MEFFFLIVYKLYSLFFCLRFLPFRQAIHIPVLIHPSVKIGKMYRGAIGFNGVIKSSMLVFGFPGTEGRSNFRSLLSINKGGKLIVGAGVTMVRGTRVVITKGKMTVGNNYCCNGDCYFGCTTSIRIGNDNICGWNTQFNTFDGHHSYERGVLRPIEGEIIIGNHVWIASNCNIAKNTFIADDCVVAQNSLVGKRFEQSKCLIGGMPAKVIKEEFTWSA